jgi:hypothetical protein
LKRGRDVERAHGRLRHCGRCFSVLRLGRVDVAYCIDSCCGCGRLAYSGVPVVCGRTRGKKSDSVLRGTRRGIGYLSLRSLEHLDTISVVPLSHSCLLLYLHLPTVAMIFSRPHRLDRAGRLATLSAPSTDVQARKTLIGCNQSSSMAFDEYIVYPADTLDRLAADTLDGLGGHSLFSFPAHHHSMCNPLASGLS